MSRIVIATLVLVVAGIAFVEGREPAAARQLALARERWLAGDVAQAHAIAAGQVERLARAAAAPAGGPDHRMELAEALALVGRGAEALAEARQAVQADPAPAAARRGRGASLLETMAIVAMEAGANEEALDVIEILLARGWHGRGRSPEEDPRFAPLRADPRFARLLALYTSAGAVP